MTLEPLLLLQDFNQEVHPPSPHATGPETPWRNFVSSTKSSQISTAGSSLGSPLWFPSFHQILLVLLSSYLSLLSPY